MPHESLEVAALRRLAAAIGAKVTSTNGDRHATNSLHFAAATGGTGLAVDLAGQRPGYETPELAAIARAVADRIGGQCLELIYSRGPCIKNRERVECARTYGATTLAAHRNHVHVAVSKGFRYTAPVAPVTKVVPMFDPPHVLEPIVAALACPTGGAWLLAVDGSIYAYGGAPYIDAPNRHPDYWGDRRAARLEPVGNGYIVVSTSGEKYAYPAT